ncbi:MAG: nuclear transport factor 2 family protein [Thermoanaerobaculia bacterium]
MLPRRGPLHVALLFLASALPAAASEEPRAFLRVSGPAPPALAPPHAETSPAEVEKQVREAHARRFAVMVQGDVAALAPLLADDLVYTHASGQVESKTQLLESLGSGRLRFRAIAAPDAAVRVHGDTAVVTGRADVQATAGGQDVAFAARYLAVYVRQGGAWRLAAFLNTRLREE